MAEPLQVRIPPQDLRDRFNRGEYMARAARGEFRPCLDHVHPHKTSGNLAGMRGYMVGFDDVASGARAFLVHFFADDDGNLGASGHEDPKWLYEDGVAYVPTAMVPPR